jgi:hypothetical protein
VRLLHAGHSSQAEGEASDFAGVRSGGGLPLTVGRRLRCAASSCIDSVDHDHDGKTNDDDVGAVAVL